MFFFNRSIFIVLGAVCLLPPLGHSALAQGESCVGLENPLLRLECFDRAYSAEKFEELPPENAVGAFMGSVNSMGPDVSINISTGEDPCVINSTTVHTRSLNSNYSASVVHSTIDLSHVKKIHRWQNPSVHMPGGVVLETDEDYPVRWLKSAQKGASKPFDARTVDLGLDSDDYGEDVGFLYEIVTKSDEHKKDEIEYLFVKAVQACSER